MPNGQTVHVQGPDGKHYAFGPQSGVTDEATARAYFAKRGVGLPLKPEATPSTWGTFKSLMPSKDEAIAAGAKNFGIDPATMQSKEDAYASHPIRQAASDQWDAMKSAAAMPFQVAGSMAKEGWRAAKAPLSKDPSEQLMGPVHLLSAMNPLAAPVVSQMTEQGLGTREANATGFGNAILLTAGAKGPKAAKTADTFFTRDLPAAAHDILTKSAEKTKAQIASVTDNPANERIAPRAFARLRTSAESGVLGDLQNSKNGAAFFDVLRDAANTQELKRISANLERFGIPKGTLTDLGDSHAPLHDYVSGSKVTGGMFGKTRAALRAVKNHPAVGLPAVGAGAATGSLVAGPWLGGTVGAYGGLRLVERLAAAKAINKLGGIPSVAGETEAAAIAGPGETAPPSPTANLLNAIPQADKAARIAKLQEMASRLESGASQRRQGLAQPSVPRGTVDIKDMQSVARSLGHPPEVARSLAQKAVEQFPNDSKAATDFIIRGGKEAPPAAATKPTPQAQPKASPQPTQTPAAAPVEQQANKAQQITSSRGLTDSGRAQRSYAAQHQREMAAFKARQEAGKQGGHAGGASVSDEELSRPGKNYVVSKGGQVSSHGKEFDPGSTRPGSTHVTVLPDGSLRVNAGQELTTLQKLALMKALKAK